MTGRLRLPTSAPSTLRTATSHVRSEPAKWSLYLPLSRSRQVHSVSLEAAEKLITALDNSSRNKALTLAELGFTQGSRIFARLDHQVRSANRLHHIDLAGVGEVPLRTGAQWTAHQDQMLRSAFRRLSSLLGKRKERSELMPACLSYRAGLSSAHTSVD